MSLTCQLLSPEEEELWQILVDTSPEGSIFHQGEWLKAIGKHYELPLKRWIVLDANQKVQGGAYLFLRKRSGLELGYAPSTDAATPYGGMLTIPPSSLHTRKQESHHKEILTLLSEKILAEGCKGTFLTFSPNFTDIRYFQWNGWQTHVYYTYFMDLTPTDVFSKLDSTARNTIRKAEKVVEVKEESHLDAFYALYADTYTRQGKTVPVHKDFLTEIFHLFQERGWVKLFMAYTSEGEAASGAVWLRDQKCSYYWLAASHRELARSTGAPALVLWNLIQAGIGQVPEMDLVGANTEPIAFFKAMFNPELRSYYSVEHTETSYRMALSAKQILSKIRSKK